MVHCNYKTSEYLFKIIGEKMKTTIFLDIYFLSDHNMNHLYGGPFE